MQTFAELQRGLSVGLGANRPGSRQEHVVVGLPSYSLGGTILEHYRPLLAPLEHRFLLAMLMLPRIPGEQLVLVTCREPEEELLDYYARLADPADPDAVRRRVRLVVVPDDGPRPLAAKLLDRPDLIAGLRELVAGRPGLIEPWNVTSAEAEVATRVGLPVNGTSPDLWPLGFKSAGRRLFAAAGVPTPCGREDVCDAAGVADAVVAMRRQRPRLDAVVVKQDNCGYGDGNWLLATRDPDGHRIPHARLRDHCLDGVPDWFTRDLAAGGVVEEFLTGPRMTSPSAQVEITPRGEVHLLSTHEQVLGGPNGQVFTGCRFPADPEYAGELGEYAVAVGRRLAAAGALGRLGVDFVAVRARGRWSLYALEVNLRKGGTTHPFTTLRNLVPGRYDVAEGAWVADLDGSPRCYRAADGLQHESWRDLAPSAVIEAVAAAGLEFGRETGTGVVLHMLGGLEVDGRMGLTAIGSDAGAVDALCHAAEAVVHRLASVTA